MHSKNAHALLAIVAAAGLVTAAACSSSDSTPSGTTTTDSGTTATDTGTTTTEDTGSSSVDTGTTSADTGTSGTDAGSTCGSDPKLRVPMTGEGPYCPGAGDAGTSTACASGQICCDTPKGSTPGSSCIAGGGTCPTTTPKAASSWECDAPSQCGTGKVCCGLGTPKLRTGCTYEEVFPAQGSKCAASCGSGEYIVCEANADCPSGKTCTAIKSGSKQIGYCK